MNGGGHRTDIKGKGLLPSTPLPPSATTLSPSLSLGILTLGHKVTLPQSSSSSSRDSPEEEEAHAAQHTHCTHTYTSDKQTRVGKEREGEGESEMRQKILTSHVGSGEVREMHLAGGDRPGPRLFEIRARRWRTGHFLVTLDDDDDGDGDDDLR